MTDEEWKEIVDSLVEAKRNLASAWSVLDGVEGAAPGVEATLAAVLDGIDEIYGIESTHEAHADVASPHAVQVFWERHRSLPGFAAGS